MSGVKSISLATEEMVSEVDGDKKVVSNLTVLGRDDLLPELDKMDDGVLLANPSPTLCSAETFAGATA